MMEQMRFSCGIRPRGFRRRIGRLTNVCLLVGLLPSSALALEHVTLRDGELERARDWGAALGKRLSNATVGEGNR